VAVEIPSPVSNPKEWIPRKDLPKSDFNMDEHGMYQSCGWPGMHAHTFDDGPHPLFTDVILKAAREHQYKVSFFWLGQMIRQNMDVAKRVVAAGHQIGSHTDTHPDLTLLTPDQIRQELDRAEKAIYSVVQARPRFFRPPYGYVNQQIMNILIKERRYKVIRWNADSFDWQSAQTPNSILKFYEGILSSGNPRVRSYIALNHDIQERTAQASSAVFGLIAEKGFKQVPLYICLNDYAYQ
jgi:peptidoglycan/xylan/chitin deacetylase (PgdA/CDA1 family)